ncbi:MAG: hypothetical protein IJ039_03290 [Clostridia bacterium]|nr:hypothetical protein [Clostridia bacterium]
MKDNIPSMPLGLQMALSHNVSAMSAFLKLDNKSQDELIERARVTQTKRELQQMVDNIPNMKEGAKPKTQI